MGKEEPEKIEEKVRSYLGLNHRLVGIKISEENVDVNPSTELRTGPSTELRTPPSVSLRGAKRLLSPVKSYRLHFNKSLEKSYHPP